MAIDPDVIPTTSSEGLNAKEAPHDYIAYITFILLGITSLLILKAFFQIILMLIGILYLIKLAIS